MSNKYKEFSQINLPSFEKEVLQKWKNEKIFEKSVLNRNGAKAFVFYEGPPSANGMPGIHHVISRTLKDLVCRYKTMQGFQVNRKGGWDTHGLPIELGVEKELGITKEDIGIKISVEEYNQKCREAVLRFKDKWDDITTKMGYWVDLNKPYVTYENNYIESVWWLLSKMYNRGLLYESVSIQPYSPAAGTGLSSHELNQPGTYKDVKDTSATVLFNISKIENQLNKELPIIKKISEIIKESKDEFLAEITDISFMAWTTTPWTLPSNLGLTVGPNIEYVLIKTFNPYTQKVIFVILAEKLISKYFKNEMEDADFNEYKKDGKNIPFKVIEKFTGKEFEGIHYDQLMSFEANSIQVIKESSSNAEPFKVVCGDFVTTEDGTGIVHTAPDFGADDFKMGQKYNLGLFTQVNKNGKREKLILVDRQGKFVEGLGEFSNRYVKNYKDDKDYIDVNVDIAVKLKLEGKAFKVEKYEHNYPHCWRTDKPILYYPLDAWFIKTTALKDQMVDANKKINWKPESTGTGRFGNWLENMVDWNLSRSRFWGTPLPIWKTEDGDEEICIGSIEQLTTEYLKAIEVGFNKDLKYKVVNSKLEIDLHKPFVDDVILVSPKGKSMKRVADLIDVWFDSGAMPYAQMHFPFENKELFANNYPADFIAEGVDQTRGWFYTLHAIASLIKEDIIEELAPLPPKGGIEKQPFEYQTADSMLYGRLKDFVKSHRSNPTQAEISLWEILRGKKLEKFKFRRQHIVGSYIIDFVNLDCKLAIEVDGLIHQLPENIKNDTDRTLWLQQNGYTVIRFSNEEVINNIEYVVEKITSTLEQLKNQLNSHQNPPLGGWGAGLAYKTVVSNGLVLDKNGVKMSKRLGNIIDPFKTIETYGADATRWYLITNASPWDNLKFDIDGIKEVQRKFFGTLYNTYQFFALYANVDNFTFSEKDIPLNERPEIDRWILSALHTLIDNVTKALDDYEPTIAGRAIEEFVDSQLSNWYVRLCRRRFWKSEVGSDKLSAYQTLYECIETIAKLIAPIAPFFCENIFINLNEITNKNKEESVHLTKYPISDISKIDFALEERMQMAQDACSLILSLRKKVTAANGEVGIKVRQPLLKVMIPIINENMKEQLQKVEDLIKTEVNIKEIEYLDSNNTYIKKKVKANFVALGKKLGSKMKAVATLLGDFSQNEITNLEKNGKISISVENEKIDILVNEVDIVTEDVPGWAVASKGLLTTALDIKISPELEKEGNARELINRIQKIRKDNNLNLTDRINVQITDIPELNASFIHFYDYICGEILANSLELKNEKMLGTEVEINGNQLFVNLNVNKN